MPERQLARVVQHFRRMLTASVSTQTTDGDLLARYVRQRDEKAFEALVHRHGAMVLGVCQRVLHNQVDAEDAFQATFLVLVRKASSIRAADRLPNWLYGVAYRAALQARNATLKRREKEAKAMVRQETTEDAWACIRPVLDQELTRLPDKYREVIILSDLEGKTRDQVADVIGCPAGTVASRLARGRALLAKRLSRHVQVLPASALLAELTMHTSIYNIPPSLLSVTVQAAAQFTGNVVAGGMISGKVVNLTQGVLKAMLLNKLMKIALLLSVLAILATGTSLVLARPQLSGIDNGEQVESLVQTAKEKEAVVPVHVLTILATYQFNEAEADEKFTNKQVRVQVGMQEAQIKRATPDNWRDNRSKPANESPAYVLIESPNISVPVIFPGRTVHWVFSFGKSAQKQLAKVTQRSTVTIEGECLGVTNSAQGKELLLFADCKVITIEELNLRGGKPGQ